MQLIIAHYSVTDFHTFKTPEKKSVSKRQNAGNMSESTQKDNLLGGYRSAETVQIGNLLVVPSPSCASHL